MSALREEAPAAVGSTTLALGLITALGPLAVNMYLPALPALAAELGSSTSEAQATVSTMLIGMGAGQLVAGPLSDAFGRRRPIFVGLALHISASLLCSVSTSMNALVALRLVQGLGGAATSVSVMAIIRDRFRGRAISTMLARLMLITGLAPILAPSLGGVILRWFSWRSIFLALAGLGLLAGVVVAVLLPESHPPARRSRAAPRHVAGAYLAVLRDRVFVAMLVTTTASASCMFAFTSASPFIYQDQFGVSEGTYTVIFALQSVAMVAGSQVSPALLRVMGPPAVLRVAFVVKMAVSAGLLVLALTHTGMVAFSVLAAVLLATGGMVNPNAQAVGLHQHPRRAGSAAAVMGLARFGIAGLVAPLVGLMGRDLTLPLATLLVVASLLGIGALVAVRARTAAEDYR